MIQSMLVIDIPAGSTAAEAQALLDGPCRQGYFLVNVVGQLAFLRMPVAKRNEVPKTSQKANADGKDAAAEQFISQHPEMSIRDLVTALADFGIPRKKTWVSDTRLRLRGSGSKLSAAV